MEFCGWPSFCFSLMMGMAEWLSKTALVYLALDVNLKKSLTIFKSIWNVPTFSMLIFVFPDEVSVANFIPLFLWVSRIIWAWKFIIDSGNSGNSGLTKKFTHSRFQPHHIEVPDLYAQKTGHFEHLQVDDTHTAFNHTSKKQKQQKTSKQCLHCMLLD